MKTTSRRGILKGLVAGAIVLGFDPVGRTWVTEAHASTDFTNVPPLDGTLEMSAAAIAEASDDFGHIIHRTPVAVLRAGSVNDIVAMVNYARANDLKVVSRGRGHSPFGQSQTDAGLIIDMRALDTIHSISNHRADVDAGVIWRDLLEATLAMGRTPPVLTDYLAGLTVGGTLSVGGVGGMSFRHGAQIDNVEEITVVTGMGQVLTCSNSQNKNLFEAALGGLGLCCVIVRAKIKLIKAEERAQSYTLFYPDVPSMLADIRILVTQKRFDYVRGMGVAAPTPTGWAFMIEGTNFYTPHDDEGEHGHHHHPRSECNCGSSNHLLDGLSFIPGMTQIADRTYFDYCDIVDQIFAMLEGAGLLALPHPWLDLFVPGSCIDDFGPNKIAEIDPAQLMPGSFMLFFGFEKSKLTRPMFRVPDEDFCFLFDMIRTAPPDPNVLAAMLAENRANFEENRAMGGTHYTISAIEMSQSDWRTHFDPVWPLLSGAKATHDPNNVLGSGVNVFPRQ